MGKHRRIWRAPSSPSSNAVRAHVGERTSGARRAAPLTVACHARRGWVGLDSNIDRPEDPSPRAVKGAQATVPSPAWSPGRRGVGGSSIACAASPIFSRTGLNVHRAPRGLYISDSHAGATHLSPRCYLGMDPRPPGVTTGDFGETLSEAITRASLQLDQSELLTSVAYLAGRGASSAIPSAAVPPAVCRCRVPGRSRSHCGAVSLSAPLGGRPSVCGFRPRRWGARREIGRAHV